MSLVAATRGPTLQSQGHPQVQLLSLDAVPVTWPADSDTQAVTQQYQPVGSAAAEQASDMTHFSSCDQLEDLAEAVMQQGCLDEEGMTAQLMKPFLPGVLRALSELSTASRYRQQATPTAGLYACLWFQICHALHVTTGEEAHPHLRCTYAHTAICHVTYTNRVLSALA